MQRSQYKISKYSNKFKKSIHEKNLTVKSLLNDECDARIEFILLDGTCAKRFTWIPA